MSSLRKRIFGMLDDSVDDEIRETKKELKVDFEIYLLNLLLWKREKKGEQ